VELRDATPADAPAVADIWYHGWRDGHLAPATAELVAARSEASFHGRAGERVDDTTVAVVDGRVVGFVMVVDDEVEQVYVDASQRGTGIADVLLREAERQVAARGHDTAWLAVFADNRRARAFYERHAWVDDGPFDYGAAGADGEEHAIAVRAHRYVKRVSDDRPSD
jgi:ribosomal protein S18 acetylase RimI-like enzyme